MYNIDILIELTKFFENYKMFQTRCRNSIHHGRIPNDPSLSGSNSNIPHGHSQSFTSDELQTALINDLLDYMDSVIDAQDEPEDIPDQKVKVLTVSKSVPHQRSKSGDIKACNLLQITPKTKIQPQTPNLPMSFLKFGAKSTPEMLKTKMPNPIAIPPSKTGELHFSSVPPRSFG